MTNQNKKENWEQEFDKKFCEIIIKDKIMNEKTVSVVELQREKIKSFISQTRNQAQIEILEKLELLEENPSSSIFLGKSYKLGRKETVKEIKKAAKDKIKELKEENEQSKQEIASGDGEGRKGL